MSTAQRDPDGLGTAALLGLIAACYRSDAQYSSCYIRMAIAMVRTIPAASRLRSSEAAMKWITRENAAVDRIACPWLIRRFVDPEAEFLFVPAADVARRAAAEGATPFDVEGVELGHVDGRCSFESIVRAHGLGTDRALARVAAVV